MRILQVVRDMEPESGGPPRVVEGLSIGLSELGHKVEIATTGERPDASSRVFEAWPGVRRSGVQIRCFPTSGPTQLGASRALGEFARGHAGEFDVIHLHGVWDRSLVVVGRAATTASVPYLVSPHGMLDSWSLSKSRLKKQAAWRVLGVGRLLNSAGLIVFGTDAEASEAARLRLKSPARVAPNGFWPKGLSSLKPFAREKLHELCPETANWDRIILFYSRVHPKKGLDLLVDAFVSVAAEFPKTGLVIAGINQDEAYKAAIHERIAMSRLPGRIEFTTDLTGPQSRFLYHASDIFVLPSHQEGFSMAIVEALACAKPVLISDRCHMDEVADWGAGRVVPPSVADVAGGLRELLEMSDEELAETGRRGKRKVLDTLTWPQVAHRMEQIYLDVAQSAAKG
jgi:glycosyltransferase involved in cell wall biosynthesis